MVYAEDCITESVKWRIFLGVGTQLKYYIQKGTDFKDVTPVRLTTSAGDVTFSASNYNSNDGNTGTALITVTDVDHGCVVGDFVTFDAAVSLGVTLLPLF